MKKLYFYVGIVFLVAAGYYLFDPQLYSFFPKCPFHLLTGFDCPGCGSQRAIHSLLNGEIGRAADHNLMLVASIPFLLIHFSYKAGLHSEKGKKWKLIYNPKTPWIIFSLMLSFWILRNIPVYPFTYLAS